MRGVAVISTTAHTDLPPPESVTALTCQLGLPHVNVDLPPSGPSVSISSKLGFQ